MAEAPLPSKDALRRLLHELCRDDAELDALIAACAPELAQRTGPKASAEGKIEQLVLMPVEALLPKLARFGVQSSCPAQYAELLDRYGMSARAGWDELLKREESELGT